MEQKSPQVERKRRDDKVGILGATQSANAPVMG
jgi:hypothetical protein